MRTIVVAVAFSGLSCAGWAAGGADMQHGGHDGHGAHGAMDKGEYGSKEEAVEMVKKGVAYLRSHRKEDGYAEITQGSRFKDRDLYLVVYALDGLVLAHGQNREMVNLNLLDMRDIDGHRYIHETVDHARQEDHFWIAHKFISPMTHKVHPMRMYCERLDDSVVCSGHFMMH